MSDESWLQVTPGSSLSLPKARSGLIARGLRDAAELVTQSDSWLATRRLAEQGDADAQYELGCIYMAKYCSAPSGGIEEDSKQAAHWYSEAIHHGRCDAYKSWEDAVYGRGGPADAEWRRRAVVAEMSANGLVMPRDLADAALRWRKAADRGDANAQFCLANMYDSGQGVPQDYTEAARWYRKAAEQGHARAQFILGMDISDKTPIFIEESGPSPAQRACWHEGAFWLAEAHGQGIGPVFYVFESMCDNGRFTYSVPGIGRWERDEEPHPIDLGSLLAQGAPQDDAEAARWFLKAADQGNGAAQISLGRMYYNGQGVPEDHNQAVSWFRKAADQGYSTAQFYMGFLFANGYSEHRDWTEAAKWFGKAADQGHANAQSWLGELYLWGTGVSQDYKEAARWFRKAAEQGDANAQFCLGWLLANGQGIPRDRAEAARWYRRAAEQGHPPAQISLSRMRSQATG